MTKEELRQLLQEIIEYLPSPIWPSHLADRGIDRKTAKNLIINFFHLDPKETDLALLVTQASQKLKAMTDKELAASLPPNLGQLVKNYEEHLLEQEKEREAQLQRTYSQLERDRTSVDQFIANLRKQMEEAEKELPEKERVLTKSDNRAKATSHQIANLMAIILPQTARESGPGALSEQEYQQVLSEAQPKISQILEAAGVHAPQTIASHLTEPVTAKKTLASAQAVAATPRRIQTIAKPEAPRPTPISPKVIQAEEILARKIGAEFQNKVEKLINDPEETKTLTKSAQRMVVNQLLKLPKKEITQDEYEAALKSAWPRIEKEFNQRGIFLNESQSQSIIDNLVKNSQREAVVLTTEAPRFVSQEILSQAAETAEGVSFVSLYTLNPKAATARLERTVYFLPAKVLEAAASETTPEWQRMINEGVFAEDYEASLDYYRKIGLPEDNSLMIALKLKQARFEIQQEGKPATNILKHYYRYPKLTGQHQVYEPDLKTYLPQLSPAPLWIKNGQISKQLQETFNQIGFASKLFEKVEIGPGKSVVRFTLPSRIIKKLTLGRFESFGAIRTTIYKKTVGKVFSFLGKTALGKTAKTLFKKGVTWLATKLGVEGGILAAGAAAAPETLGISLLIAAVVDIGIEIAQKIFGKVWDALKSIIRDPEKSFGLIAGGILAAFVLPLSFFGFVIAGIGAVGLAGWGIANAGAIASGIGGGLTVLFTAIVTLPFTAAVGLFITSIIGGIMTITFFIVMTTAGAFILPVGPTEMIEGVLPPTTPPKVSPPPGLDFRWPVYPYSCSSNYGYRTLTINGRTTCDYHEGIDIPASIGSSVYATARGEVTAVGYHSGYGNYVVIKHNGLYSFYAHLLAPATTVGSQVNQLTVIGYVGNTGHSTGPHLHFGFSTCGDVPSCFANGKLTPDPCDYLVCPEGCSYQDRNTGCPI